MSEWRGLHNPERHKGNQPDTRCVRCHGGYEVCEPDAPCYCCLAAEVESLQEALDRCNELCRMQNESLAARSENVDRMRAQVQRVREACEPFGPMGSIAVWRVLRALDGDNDA